MKERLSKFRVKYTPEGCVRLTVWGEDGHIAARATWPTFKAAMDWLEAHFVLEVRS